MQQFDLPIEFIEKISRSFGDTGKVWLLDLPETIEVCAQQWRLQNLEVACGLSYNLILFAQHPQYGPVVLKIGVPHLDLFSEMEAIQLYEGHGICRCYALDKTRGAMLLERILPGKDLRSVQDAGERFRIAADLYARNKTEVPEECGLPTYQNLIERAIKRLPEYPHMPAKLMTWLYQIKKQHKNLVREAEYLTVLHCDLHHMNILQDGEEWKLIDPKGFIGIPAMECIRFMQNEVDLYPTEDPKSVVLQMISLFAPALGVSEDTVKECYFIDSVLSCTWSHEDSSPGEQLDGCLASCQLGIELMKTIRK